MSVKVTPILGHVAVLSGGELIKQEPASNNTRWIFEVEGGTDAVVVQLLDPRNKKPLKPDIVSCSFLPMDSSFYDARPFIEPLLEEEQGTLRIKYAGIYPNPSDTNTVKNVSTRYRVQVDIMHSATR